MQTLTVVKIENQLSEMNRARKVVKNDNTAKDDFPEIKRTRKHKGNAIQKRFSWVRDGTGKKFIYSPDFMKGRYVIFSPLKNEYFYDCLDLLEAQYK